MDHIRQYLKEVAFTYSSDEWEKSFSSVILNASDVLDKPGIFLTKSDSEEKDLTLKLSEIV